MAKVLILGSGSTERAGLALFMEFVGHQCSQAKSLQEAARLLAKEPHDLVLADAAATDAESGQIVRMLKAASPDVTVMMLAEEASPAVMDDVITSPLTAVPGLTPQYPPLRKGEAFLVLLPEQDSVKMLPDLPQSPGLLNKLALLYQSQQKYTVAEQLYRRALDASEHSPGNHTREVSSILMNLAGLYQDQKKYAQAEPLYRRSLKLAEKVYGADNPKVARRLRRLAEIYRLLGREAEAAPVHERLSKFK
jgi:tetratricopeptide (TPR) repeat protein